MIMNIDRFGVHFTMFGESMSLTDFLSKIQECAVKAAEHYKCSADDLLTNVELDWCGCYEGDAPALTLTFNRGKNE